MEQHVEKLKVAENKVLIIRGVSSVGGGSHSVRKENQVLFPAVDSEGSKDRVLTFGVSEVSILHRPVRQSLATNAYLN